MNKSQARTRVCITIDTEFSIGGAFADKNKRPVAEPLVWCNVGDESHGLGFMLETFRQHEVQATFFVETVHRHYFKNDPMRSIAQRIHSEGHEVQLHTHPCWDIFQNEDWWDRSRGMQGRDNISKRSIDEAVTLINQGIDTFREWGLPRPLAFRSGNLHHGDNLYRALSLAGIPYSSNVGLAVYNSGDARYKLYSGQHERHGVREFPVLSFSDWRFGNKSGLRTLTIAGSSTSETRRLLEEARAMEIPLVVILTHPFEYVQNRDLAFQQTRRNHLTQGRLQNLCRFLQQNKDRFDATGLVSAAQSLPTTAAAPNTLLQGALHHTIPRMAAQFAYHRFGQWLLARKYGAYKKAL